jgi:DNA repair protein RadB
MKNQFLEPNVSRSRTIKKLSTLSKSLDKLLNGGIETGILTNIYGDAGAGKTNICLQVACSCIKGGKKVAYIDTEGVSVERLYQIGGSELDFTKIIFFTPHTLEEQEKQVKALINIKGLGLIIVDTINTYLRLKYLEDPDGCDIPILRQLDVLHTIARKSEVPVIITGQVYMKKDFPEIKQFGGKNVEYFAKTIIKLEKIGINKRKATLMKHRSLPEGTEVEFNLTPTGVE